MIIKTIIKTALLALNSVTVLLMLFSTMAGTIAPSRFMLFSMLSYFYLYLLIANILFIVVWLALSSKWFILPLLAIVLRWSFVPLFFQVGGQSEYEGSAENTITVLTFNAHHFEGVERDGSLTDTNMRQFLAIVDEEWPDMLTVQEYSSHGVMVDMTGALHDRGYKYYTSGYRNGNLTGTVLFSKLPISDVGYIDGASEFYADVKWHDTSVRVFCLHLDSYRLDDSDREELRKMSRGEMDGTTGLSTYNKFRETILSHEAEWRLLEPYFAGGCSNVIVAGDMNDTPASYVYQKMSKYFTDSYCETGQGFSRTYHGFFQGSGRVLLAAMRIDMILHGDNFKSESYKRRKCDISDHYPVISTLTMQ